MTQRPGLGVRHHTDTDDPARPPRALWRFPQEKTCPPLIAATLADRSPLSNGKYAESELPGRMCRWKVVQGSRSAPPTLGSAIALRIACGLSVFWRGVGRARCKRPARSVASRCLGECGLHKSPGAAEGPANVKKGQLLLPLCSLGGGGGASAVCPTGRRQGWTGGDVFWKRWTGQGTPVPPRPQYPQGFLARYCWWYSSA